MKKLYSHFRSLSLLLLCSATVAQCMEPQKDKPITFAQIYYRLAEFLHPDVMPLILSFHLNASGIDYKNLPDLIKERSKSADAFVQFIDRLLKPGNHTLVAEIFERAFAHEKVSICDIKNDSNGMNVLHEASANQHPEVVKIILNIAGNKTWELLTAKSKTLGRIPLHNAAMHVYGKRIGIVKLLLEAASDKTWTLLTIKDNFDDWTALHYAANNGSTEMVKLLLDAAGDNTWTLLATKSKTGLTALHKAAYRNYSDTVELLLNTAGDNAQEFMNIQSDHKKTALHYAANNNSTEIVELLLNTAKNSAQEFMDIQNDHKETAFDIAGPEIKEVMEKYRKNNQ